MVNFVQKLINTSKLRRVEHCCWCVELARWDRGKKYVYVTVKLVKLQKKHCGLTYLNEIGEKKRNTEELNESICLFFIFHLLCLFLSFPWNFWPQLDCEYESLNFLVSVWLCVTSGKAMGSRPSLHDMESTWNTPTNPQLYYLCTRTPT